MRSRCVCIKTYYNSDYNSNVPIFRNNETYEYTDQKFITREMPDGYNVMLSKGEYIYFRKHPDVLAETGYGMFNTYFRTLKEVRKEKLIKIKNGKT